MTKKSDVNQHQLTPLNAEDETVPPPDSPARGQPRGREVIPGAEIEAAVVPENPTIGIAPCLLLVPGKGREVPADRNLLHFPGRTAAIGEKSDRLNNQKWNYCKLNLFLELCITIKRSIPLLLLLLVYLLCLKLFIPSCVNAGM